VNKYVAENKEKQTFRKFIFIFQLDSYFVHCHHIAAEWFLSELFHGWPLEMCLLCPLQI